MLDIIKLVFSALFLLSGVVLGIEIGILFSWWIGVFVGFNAACIGFFVAWDDKSELLSYPLTLTVCIIVWLYTFSIDVKCWFHNGLLSTEKNTTTYIEMLYNQAKDNDIEDSIIICDNFGEWLETLEDEQEVEVVKETIRQYFKTHKYQEYRLDTFYEKHQDELPSLSCILSH